MRISLKWLFPLLVLLLSLSSNCIARAYPLNLFGTAAQHSNKPDFVLRQELESWYGECEQRIRRAGLQKFRVEHADTRASCFCTVDNSGKPASFEIVKSSGVEAVDESLICLIRKASPFSSPPNNFAFTEGIVISVSPQSDVDVEQASYHNVPRLKKQLRDSFNKIKRDKVSVPLRTW